MPRKKTRTPSLLESEARGGDIAESGFSFQEQVTLALLPSWLAHDGFTAIIREAMGDTEVKFFVPSRGFAIDLLEVKNHILPRAEFWREIERFQKLDGGAPGTFRRFTLACVGLSEVLHPLYHGLRRIRDPLDFYPDASLISRHSWDNYIQIVTALGRTESDALFLFEKVDMQPDFNSAHTYGEALFTKALVKHMPSAQDLSGRVIQDIYERLSLLLRGHRNSPIMRHEIEVCIHGATAHIQRPTAPPIHIVTLSDHTQRGKSTNLTLDWSDFFGGSDRSYPPMEDWNNRLFQDLLEIRAWIIGQHRPRRIQLQGSRRLSAAMAIGWVFSAVAGFALEIGYRGDLWATDAYATSETPDYILQSHFWEGSGNELVVGIGILRNIGPDLDQALLALNLKGKPRIDLFGETPVSSPQHANVAVQTIKAALAVVLTSTKCQRIHLFYAGPSHLASFLAHRLNATTPIQCYEYIGPAIYTPTVSLV